MTRLFLSQGVGCRCDVIAVDGLWMDQNYGSSFASCGPKKTKLGLFLAVCGPKL